MIVDDQSGRSIHVAIYEDGCVMFEDEENYIVIPKTDFEHVVNLYKTQHP